MIKRTRSRTNNMRTPNKQNNPSVITSADDRNEIRLKNRNHYQQMLDKYSTLARESLRSGDRIEAEVHYQYAEHYLRQLNERIRHDTEMQQVNQQRQQQRENDKKHRNHMTQNTDNPQSTETFDQQPRENQSAQITESTKKDCESQTGDQYESENESTENSTKTQPRRRGTRNFYKRTRSEDSTPQQQETSVSS